MIVSIATAWNASVGGINAFNIELTRAIARTVDMPVVCGVTSASGEEIASACRDGVVLVVIPCDGDGKPQLESGETIMSAIGAEAPADVRLWIGHDLVSGEAAAAGAANHGGELALIHHMDYQSYQNFGGDRGNDAAGNQRRQIRLFQTPDAILFGVGSWLAYNVSRLGARKSHVIVPGFPGIVGVAERLPTDRLLAVTAGRFSEGTERLKRIGAALDGFATAVRDGVDLALLKRSSMTVLGVTEVEMQKDLHLRAETLAGRPINVIAARFDDDPTAVAELASVSDLVVVPSRHEGFGLVGWEAIGTETPLIIGDGTGLAHQLKTTLDGMEQGLVSILDLDGSDRDVQKIAEAVRRIAGDLEGAIGRARRLRSRLVSELSCDWTTAATDFLVATGMVSAAEAAGSSITADPPVNFGEERQNNFERCVELGASAVQGSTRRSVEIVAELRFGVTEIKVEDIEAELSLKRVTLEVRPRTGRLRMQERLGEGARSTPGLEAKAGGVWYVKPVDGDRLDRKMLGNESLCVVESTGEHSAVVDVEVTTSRQDIRCDISSKRRVSKAAEKVMAVFLKDCACKPVSGHVILSTAIVREQA